MLSPKLRKKIFTVILVGFFLIGCLIFYAFARTWGKTELEFKIHINEELTLQSVYGESPTFAIWIENPETGKTKTIFVTNRAEMDDWEGKASVPTALPLWYSINNKGQQTEREDMDIDAISGATPLPGYFVTRANINPNSKWTCWIEMNLAGDYNEHYPEFDETKQISDEYGTGQPAIIYRADIEAIEGFTIVPEVFGMSISDDYGDIIQPLEGITTALDVFDEIEISVVKPKPKIL